ncbi:MAG: spermidine/putrescine ABC transporter substrate-binding protein [Candidatus Poribacteria bacterium]|nr:MAG: spermidine/putrescine ABC transporter substrate-binding protein [Candidatus Poribacteria bacterium]
MRGRWVWQCLVAGALGAVFVMGCGRGESKQELNLFTWSDYISEEAVRRFEEEYNAHVVIDTFEDNDELVAKLQAGVTGYDVIVPSDYAVQQLINLGLVLPLNKENIPNFQNLDPRFLDQYFDPGNVYSVPYLWGTAGIGYNSEVIPEPPDSWWILWDEKYKGEINMLDEMRETMAVALKMLGYSVNTTDPQQIAEARDLLIRQKPLVRSYTTETDDLMVSGQILLTHAWNGDVLRVAEEYPQWKYVVPKEGSTFFLDNLCIPKGTDNKELAEKFINFILEPEIIASVSAFTHYGNAVPASMDYLPEELKNDPAVFPPDEVIERLEMLRDVGDAEVLYGEAWTAIKSAGG